MRHILFFCMLVHVSFQCPLLPAVKNLKCC